MAVSKVSKVLLLAMAGVGTAGTVAAIVLYLARAELAEFVLHRAFENTAIQVKDAAVSAPNAKSMRIDALALEWRGQKISIDSIEARIGGLLPPTVESVAARGVNVALDVGSLAHTAPATVKTTPSEFPRIGSFSTDVLVTVGANRESPLGRLTLSLKGNDHSAEGAAVVSTDASSATLVASVPWDGSGTKVQWREAKGDLADLLAKWRMLDSSALAGWAVEGKIRSSGELAQDGEKLSGNALTFIEVNRASSSDLPVSIQGLQMPLQGKFAIPTWSVESSAPLTIHQVSAAGIEISDLEGQLAVDQSQTVQVIALKAKAFGGEIQLTPCAVTFDPLRVRTRLILKSVDLAKLAGLFDDLGAEVTGRASGEIDFSIDGTKLRFHGGGVMLDAGSPATLRLQKKGILTNGMDPKGILYPTLEKVESGVLNLAVDSLRAEVYEEKGDDAISARVSVAGHPVSADVTAPVQLSVNFHGPLATLLTHLINQKMQP